MINCIILICPFVFLKRKQGRRVNCLQRKTIGLKIDKNRQCLFVKAPSWRGILKKRLKTLEYRGQYLA